MRYAHRRSENWDTKEFLLDDDSDTMGNRRDHNHRVDVRSVVRDENAGRRRDIFDAVHAHSDAEQARFAANDPHRQAIHQVRLTADEAPQHEPREEKNHRERERNCDEKSSNHEALDESSISIGRTVEDSIEYAALALGRIRDFIDHHVA